MTNPVAGVAPPSGGTVASAIEQVRAAVGALAAMELEQVDAVEVAAATDTLRATSDQLRLVLSRLLAHVEADGRWAASGSARSFPDWVARRGGSSVGTARRETALGKALATDLPGTRSALADGRLSLEHAQVLAQVAATSDARRAALAGPRADRNEEHLVRAGEQMGVDEFRRTVRRWAAAVDTATHEAEHAAAVDREGLHLVRRRDGVEVQGFLALESADLLATALRAASGVPAADDPRSPEQRRAAALTQLARIALNGGLAGAGKALVRPHISVHVPFGTFALLTARDDGAPGGVAPGGSTAGHRLSLEGPGGTLGAAAELDDGTPLPLSVLARLACDAEITRVVLGPDSEPLDVGRTQRTYTGAQRRAVIARDRHCQYPGCGAPPVLGEVHHVRWWSRGGATSVENAVLVCTFHHHVVHRRGLAITRAGDTWEFREQGGRLVGTGRPDRQPASSTDAARPPDATEGRARPPGSFGGPTRPPGPLTRSARPPGSFGGPARLDVPTRAADGGDQGELSLAV